MLNCLANYAWLTFMTKVLYNNKNNAVNLMNCSYFNKIIVVIFLILISSQSIAQESVRVTDISGNTELVTISPGGRRQVLTIAGVQPVQQDPAMHLATRKRLRTLLLGKTVLIQPIVGNNVMVNYGDLDIAERLLEEGLVDINPIDIHAMSFGRQQSYISAQERAIQNKRGHWFNQQPQTMQKYYQPYWPNQGLPLPMRRAPVFTP